MKIILSLALMFSFAAQAKAGVSPECARRVVKYRTVIIQAAQGVSYLLGVSAAERELYPAELQEREDASSLEQAVFKLRNRELLNERQVKIVSAVCELTTFDVDSVGGALENLRD